MDTNGSLFVDERPGDEARSVELPFMLFSDPHFAHFAIQKLADRPADHWQRTLASICEHAKPGVTIVCAGDLLYRASNANAQRWLEPIKQTGAELLLIRGNHDKWTKARYARLGFTVIKPFSFQWTDSAGKTWTVWVAHRAVHELLDDDTLMLHGHSHHFIHDDPRLINISVEQTDYEIITDVPRLLAQRVAQIREQA